MSGEAVRALFAKELRQVRRSRGAILSTTLLPFFLMVVAPIGQYLSLRDVPPGAVTTGFAPPGLSDLREPEQIVTLFFLPFLMVIVGLIVPTTAAVHTVVSERDRRTIELLVALPVGVREILAAKLLATIVMTGGVVVPLFAIDALWLLWTGLATAAHVVLLFLLLLSALACSIALALLVSLLARDQRTANQINGVLIGPLILALLSVFSLVPGDARWWAAVGLLLVVGAVALLVALRWLTFERYLA